MKKKSIKIQFKEVRNMTLVRWQSPFTDVDRLQRQMNRLFEDTWPSWVRESETSVHAPAAEMSETEDALTLKLEIPGMEAKDLDIDVSKDNVVIRGERKQEEKTEEDGMTRSEFRYGKFERVIPLPIHIDNQNVTAEYKNGILRLSLPKAEEEKNKVVKVNVA
jgi:HSP20 family protein